MPLLPSVSTSTQNVANAVEYYMPQADDGILKTIGKGTVARIISMVAMPIFAILSATYQAAAFIIKTPLVLITLPLAIFWDRPKDLQTSKWLLHLLQISFLATKLFISLPITLGLVSPQGCLFVYRALDNYHDRKYFAELYENVPVVDNSNQVRVEVSSNDEQPGSGDIPVAPPLAPPSAPTLLRPSTPTVTNVIPKMVNVKTSGLFEKYRQKSVIFEKENATRMAQIFSELEQKAKEQKNLELELLKQIDAKKNNGEMLTDKERINDFYLRLDPKERVNFDEKREQKLSFIPARKEGETENKDEIEKIKTQIDLKIIEEEIKWKNNGIQEREKRIQEKNATITLLTDKMKNGQVLTSEEKEQLRLAKLSPEDEDLEIKSKCNNFLQARMKLINTILTEEDSESETETSDSDWD